MPIDQSWAYQMDDDDDLDDRQVEFDGDMKIITEIRHQDGKKLQVKQYFKTEKRRVSLNVAKRKTWMKFGLSANDPPGPNPKTTYISEEISMEYLNQKDEENLDLDLSQQFNKGIVNPHIVCRHCSHNHWTMECPLKNEINALNKYNDSNDSKDDDRTRGRLGLSMLKDGKRLDLNSRSKDENNTIRITNLPEETQDEDIKDLFKNFGKITRIFLAKDKATGNSKGFAFVSLDTRENAARAIRAVNGHGYNNLILSVEWARPSGN
ncbi:Eukaryotic translation initiation factor 3 subunit G [Sarcoptes scabiei]|uniref:Eukaryotic translation initiation factor 3 subunit G n=1 Tax=Sarcoptes scabiei TaxID=52283 RepID=A0A132ACW1_SARSC|nr:Eukaryotic translation initiation factor 3 subunit G [Sarcoptes scabiei]KPM08808.1 eukaryotic translation initiation factor 3 subunit G-like protein [Sarcoptes scabiei]UXI22727.1 Mediator of RNA polymerase II transcription subunit 8 [Sarcoptes scabiei]